MRTRSFHITSVLFHLEGTLIRSDAQPPKATERCKASPCARDVIALIRGKGLGLGIISRHGGRAVRQCLQRAFALRARDLDLILSRNELLAAGKNANPLRMVSKIIRHPPGQVLLVSSDPVLVAQARTVGLMTAFVAENPQAVPAGTEADFHIADLGAITRIIRLGTPLRSGKLPNDLLRELLGQVLAEDPSILIHPGVGEDIAAVDVTGEEVLVLKSDPITFATDAIGQYAVMVNANDIATAGARPRWLLTTLLFPPDSTAASVWSVVCELQEVCRKWGITLCGGHTEITDAVTRPVVVGMMAGTVRRGDLVDKRSMRPGDSLLLTKGVAVEGTAIIAREFSGRLKSLGMADDDIRACRQFLDRISIIPEAGIAAAIDGTSAMHDVTEGGIATALEELSAAGGHRLRVDVGAIPIFPETRRVCRLLGVHPLGLIGSGSLLICCRNACRTRIEKALHRAGIPVACIGAVREKGTGVEAVRNGRPARWRSFEVDEIARLFARKAGR